MNVLEKLNNELNHVEKVCSGCVHVNSVFDFCDKCDVYEVKKFLIKEIEERQRNEKL